MIICAGERSCKGVKRQILKLAAAETVYLFASNKLRNGGWLKTCRNIAGRFALNSTLNKYLMECDNRTKIWSL